MIVRRYLVPFKKGLHARPISTMVRDLSRYNLKSCIVESMGRKSDVKSVISMLMLSAIENAPLKFFIEGVDELKAADYIEWFFSQKKEEDLYVDSANRPLPYTTDNP